MQWEYKPIAIAFNGTTQLEAELNDMGKDGWELVHFGGGDEPEEDGLFYANCVFKRLIQPAIEFSVTKIGDEALNSLLSATQQRGRGKPGART